jgi:flagellar motor switch protein FliM
MSNRPVLNQDEINALLNGMKQGTITTETAQTSGEARPYDLGTEARVPRGRMPVLETINERFARLYATSLYGILRQSARVGVVAVQAVKFGNYLQELQAPCSLNVVTIRPLRGASMIVVSTRLVALVVDSFFGGKGRDTKIESRDFSATETRMIDMLLDAACVDLQDAWASTLDIAIERSAAESNPKFVDRISHSEIVAVSRFNIDLDGATGEMHVVIPYAALEPLRDLLAGQPASKKSGADSHWAQSLREEIADCEVSLTTVFGHSELALSELLNMKPGDVVPCDFQGGVTVYAEDVPILRGGFGVSRGQMAVQVNERLIGGRSTA